ncbi:MAG TPA: hypothetical protein VIQ00_13225 [Chitinophagaceae bacterium]
MHTIFSLAAFSAKQLICPACTWQGNCKDSHQEHLLLTRAIELYCPDCQHYFGFVNKDEGE